MKKKKTKFIAVKPCVLDWLWEIEQDLKIINKREKHIKRNIKLIRKDLKKQKK